MSSVGQSLIKSAREALFQSLESNLLIAQSALTSAADEIIRLKAELDKAFARITELEADLIAREEDLSRAMQEIVHLESHIAALAALDGVEIPLGGDK